MAEVKKEFFPEMATPSNSRNRTLETAERHIFCPEEGCTMNGTLRKIRKHWNEKHSTGNRLASVTCGSGQCLWLCFSDSLSCFTKHTKAIHFIRPNANTEFTITGRIPASHAIHSQHCNSSSSEAKALSQERTKQRRRERAAAEKLKRQARRVKSKNPAVVVNTNRTEIVETKNINISNIGEVNIKVTKRTVRERKQNREVDDTFDRLVNAPYVGEHVIYFDDEDDASENAEVIDITGDEANIQTELSEPIIIEDSESDEEYEIFSDVEIEEGDEIIELGAPEIHTDFLPSESESEIENTDSDSEDDIPLVQLNKRKLKPIIRQSVKKSRGV